MSFFYPESSLFWSLLQTLPLLVLMLCPFCSQPKAGSGFGGARGCLESWRCQAGRVWLPQGFLHCCWTWLGAAAPCCSPASPASFSKGLIPDFRVPEQSQRLPRAPGAATPYPEIWKSQQQGQYSQLQPGWFSLGVRKMRSPRNFVKAFDM